MKYVSVCSGMEAASVAWHDLGWTPVAFAEIDPFPSAILKHRFPNIPNYGDLTKYKEWPIEPGTVDLVVGGTPCQAFSVAGLRKGLADPRGNLSLTFLGLVQHLRPRWVLWENVPGVLSSGKPAGSDFASFLAGLGELGYGWAYRICDAQYYGVPQRRRRIFVVATNTGDWRVAAEALSLAEGMRGYLEASDAKRKGTARRAKGGSGADGLDGTVGTLCADSHPGAYSGQDAYTGRLIPQATSHWDGSDVHPTLNQSAKATGAPGYSNQEIFSQQGGGLVPAPMMFKVRGGVESNSGVQGGEVGKTAGKGFLGNEDQAFTLATTTDQWLAQPIPFRKAKRAQSDKDDETWVEAEASNTLNNFDLGDTRTTHAVVEPQAPFAFIQNQRAGVSVFGDKAASLTAGNGTHMTNYIAQDKKVTHCADVAPTVTSSGPPYSRTGNERVECEALVTQPHIVQASELRLSGKITEQPICPTLKANAKSGDTEPLVVAPTVTTCKGSRGGCSSEAIDEITAIHQAQGVDLYNQTLTGDVHVPLRTAGGHGAPAAIEPVSFQPGNLRRRGGADPSETTFPTLKCDAGDQSPHVATQMAVRRLSVRECERLQGFPDDWSMIPWKGKPADQCPDGPRYKACGNSMAVPVMRHLGKAIAAMDAKLKGIG